MSKDEYDIHIAVLGTPTMDYFNRIDGERTDAVKMHEALTEVGIWAKGDKVSLSHDLYTYVNRRFQNASDFKDMITSVGGSEANMVLTAVRALRDTGLRIKVTFLCTVSDKPSGRRIMEKLNQFNDGRNLVEVYPKLPAEQQEQVTSPSSFIFNKIGEKFVAKGMSRGNKEFINSGHIESFFANNRVDIALAGGSAVDKYTRGTAYAFIGQAANAKANIAFLAPTEFNEEKREFAGFVIDNHVTMLFLNTTELAHYYDPSKDRAFCLARLQETLSKRADHFPMASITAGIDGGLFVMPDSDTHSVGLWNEDTIAIDVTGAGDNNNGGVFAGLIMGYDQPCNIGCAGYIGAAMSDAVIQQIGAQLNGRSPDPADIAKAAIERFKKDNPHVIIENPSPRLVIHGLKENQK